MSLPEIIRTYWPIASFATPFILAGGFAWLKTQFPTKADLEKLRGEASGDLTEMRLLTMSVSDRQLITDTKIKTIETELDRAPSKLDLSKDIGKVAERVGHLESGLDALNDRMATANDYLKVLIEKHIP